MNKKISIKKVWILLIILFCLFMVISNILCILRIFDIINSNILNYNIKYNWILFILIAFLGCCFEFGFKKGTKKRNKLTRKEENIIAFSILSVFISIVSAFIAIIIG